MDVVLLIQESARQVRIGSIDVDMLVILLADIPGYIVHPEREEDDGNLVAASKSPCRMRHDRDVECIG